MADGDSGGGVVRRLYSEFIIVDRAAAQLAKLNGNLDGLQAAADDAAGATEGVGVAADKSSDDLEKQSKQAEASTEKTDKLRNAMLGLGAAFTAVGVAGNLYFGNAAKEYGKYATTLTAYTNIVGESSSSMLAGLQDATKGTVANTELVLSANRALAMGISQESLPRLAEIAEAAGRIMGTDTADMFDNIVTGIARGSPMILDNLGIIIKVGEANEAYAQSIGKSAAALTKEEQTMAMLNAVMEKGQTLIDKAGASAGTAASASAQLSASLSNLNLTMGEAANGPMTAWYNLLATIADKVSTLPAPLLTIIATIGMAGSAISSVIGPLMLQAAAVMFLRQQWMQFRAGLAATPLFTTIAQGGLAGLTASLYAAAAAAWALLVPFLPLIAAVAALAGVALAIDWGINGNKSIIGSLLSPSSTSDSLTTQNINVNQYNDITQNAEISTTKDINDFDVDRFMQKAADRMRNSTNEQLKQELRAYL